MTDIETPVKEALKHGEASALTFMQKNVWWFLLGAFVLGAVLARVF